ncbi:MAG: immunoglobulin domain-containing protein [Myxococcales bacterium]|nr:immunoglobulin domain-containing protein [Myxococcales bacterium]
MTSSGRLRVNANAPVVETGPADTTVAEGGAATFTVSARGTGLTYTWSRDGVAVPGATSASYVLSSARYPEDDGAQLTVEVRNVAGAVTAGPATLRVTQAAPTLTSGPSAQRVTEGETATFAVTATGSLLSYAWEREVAGAWVAVGPNASTLSVADAQVADAGRYRVVVRNDAGSVTSDAVTLTVDLAAPSVTSAPSDVSVREGEAATFTVVARGTDVTYQWLRNGVAVEGATSASYTLASAALTDDGARFAVRVSNAGGEVTSTEATLSVALAPPQITAAPTSVEVDEGATASFTVAASGSQLTYRWQKDGVDLATTTTTLSLVDVSLADAGAYRVVVSNGAGSVTSSEATLVVRRVAPRIVTEPIDQTVDDGAPAFFAVVGAGSDLSYQWFDASGPIAGETESTLSFVASLTDDGRVFYVVVSNPAGDATSAGATLVVRPRAPTITAQPMDTTVLEGGVARFEVAADGSEPLSYQWLEDGLPIADATAAAFELSPVAYASSGRRFAARVANAGGEVITREALLTVQLAPPRVVTGPESQVVVEGTSVRLEVVAEGSELTYTWRKDGGETLGSEPTLELGAVGPEAAGVYSVVVANAAGSVERSATIGVTLAPPTITDEPADVSVGEGAGASFAVVASGTSLSYQWQRDGADVPGATSPTFALASTRLLDDGASFRVRVSNAGGEVWSRSARLSVAPAPPVITGQPSSVTVTEGESASLSLVAVGAGLTYQWYRGETPVGGSAATLTFGTASLSDAGTYHCVVTNATGSVTSAQATVTVRLVPPAVTSEPADVEVGNGGSVSLTVAATGRDLTYEWLRLGAPIAGATSPTYTFDATFADDGVTFTARVSNSGGSVLSRAALVRVRDDVAPTLRVEGPATRSTTEASIRLVGTANDEGVGLAGVTVTSATLPEGVGASVSPSGAFEVDVPLVVGENVLSVTARDRAGNSAEQRVTVTQTLPLVPRIAITMPTLGERTEDAQVDVEGRLYTQLSVTEIRVALGALVVFPSTTDVDGVYAFRFDSVPLRLGTNVLTVEARTPFGAVSAQTVIARDAEGGDGGTTVGTAPRIALPFAGSHLYLDTDSIPVRGTVTDDRCVEAVAVNGVPVAVIGAGAEVGFATTLTFGGATSLPVRIEARDCDGNVSEIRFTAHLDDTAPVVTVTGLASAPTVHPVLRTPYPVSGTVRDTNIASFTVAGTSVPLLPTADPALWTFRSNVALTRGSERRVVFEARDRAGRSGRSELLFRLDAEIDLELVSPLPGDRLVARGESAEVPVRVRVPGLAPGDTVVATLDGGMQRTLAASDGVYVTSFTDIANGAEHELVVTARAEDGRTLATANATFELVDESSIPLELVRMTPESGATGIEANQFVSLLFNRPVDPSRLRVEVRETVHGEIYAPPPEGADLTNATRVDRVYVDRDGAPVPGHVTNLPGGSLIAFYPSRDYGYGGEVRVEVFLDDTSVARGNFRVRTLPTLVTGFVADHDGRPLPNVEVELPRMGTRLRTDREGAFELGWGWPADRVIPPGEHLVIVNPEGRNPAYGTLERRVVVRPGQTNLLGQLRVPWLDPSEPRRILVAGESNTLMSGDLVVDLTDAELAPTVVEPVAVHAQMMETRRLGHPFSWSAVPDWAFVLTPNRLDVVGDVRVTLRFPLFRGSHDYVDGLADYGVLYGLDPESLRIVPMGVGQLDRATRTVRAVGATHFRRLDVIGFGRARDALLPSLEAYARGELSIVELTHRLETTP